MGVEPISPPLLVIKNDDPTPTDYQNFNLGTLWLNKSTQDLWYLSSLENHVATWTQLNGGGGGTLQSLTGDDNIPVDPLNGNIDVLGALAGSTVAFDGDTLNTLTLNATDSLDNTLIGLQSGNASVSGNSNTALGRGALHSLASGDENTAIGFASLSNIQGGDNNIALGAIAGSAYTASESNNIVIGNIGIASEDDTIRIGDTQIKTFIEGIYGSTGSVQDYQVVKVGLDGQLVGGGDIVDQFDADVGSAIPALNVINIVGGANASTSATGNTITISCSSPGNFNWLEITGTSQSMSVDTGYIPNNVAEVALSLPVTAPVGSIMRVSGKGSGGWKIVQNSGQTIYFGIAITTPGVTGFLASTESHDGIDLLCITANTEFNVINSIGNITVS